MSDDKNTRGYRDRSRIDYSQDYERNYWTRKWDISSEQLKEALKNTDSVMVSDIEEYLKKKSYI